MYFFGGVEVSTQTIKLATILPPNLKKTKKNFSLHDDVLT